MKHDKSEYDQQAADFLTRFGITLTIRRAKDKRPEWVAPGDSHGNHYRVTLSHSERSPLRFDFWGSIRDRKNGENPSAYDVLACISGDIYCADTFKEFCADHGYDEDSRKAFAMFKRFASFAKKLRAFFVEDDEQEALSQIQ